MKFYEDGTPVGLGLVKLAFAQQPQAPGGGLFGGMTTVQNPSSPNSSNPFTMTTAQTGTAAKWAHTAPPPHPGKIPAGHRQ